nr:unnamed protein product [Callosobruchus analis]
MFKLDPICSIFTSELKAIGLALDWDYKIIASILEKELHLKRIGKSVTFIWGKGHARIDGNEKVDRLSKEAALIGQEVESVFKWDAVSKRKVNN